MTVIIKTLHFLVTPEEIMLNLAAGSLRFVKRPTPDPRDATIKKPPDWAWDPLNPKPLNP